MPYNSNTLFQKMPDKVSFFYAQISKKWLELSLKKFSSYIFKNNGESETVLYLTNGRKRSFSRNSIFSLLLFDHESNFHMTLVNDSPHVASLLRINISKLGCALQAYFIYAIALTSLRSSGSISLNSVAPYRLISFYAIALTSLRSSGSISLNSSATCRLISFTL